MSMVAVMRKSAVIRRIEDLPVEKKGRARELYVIIDKIEWLTIAPLYFGMLAVPLFPFPWMFMADNLPGEAGMIRFYGFVSAAFLYAVGVFALKMLVCNPRRNGVVEKLQTVLLSNHNYQDTLETLKQLDPDMAKNIKKCLMRVTGI